MAYNAFPSYSAYPAYSANNYQQQYSQIPQSQYVAQNTGNYSTQQQSAGIVWVDGEVGAKAFQLPPGWPANAPMPLWDTNDTIIYLKSINQMGMPNPIQKVRYKMEDSPRTAPVLTSQATLPSGETNAHGAPDMSQYVRKDEMEQLKEELKAAIHSIGTDVKGESEYGKSSV